MFQGWWFMWMLFALIFLISPIGYGSGYRRWGWPYPTYVQRRRHHRMIAANGVTSFNHQAWGRGGDFIWVVLGICVVWLVVGRWWH
jgi:hypothetical protein